jgi:mevalonate kinase
LKSQAIAPGKVILTGEHFVVYGAPAIVSAVNIHSNTTASRRRDQKIVVKSSSPECTISIKDGHCEVLRGGKIAESLLEPISVLAQATLRKFGDQHNGLKIGRAHV